MEKDFNFIQDNLNGLNADVNNIKRNFNFIQTPEGVETVGRTIESFGKNFTVNTIKTIALEKQLPKVYSNPVEVAPDGGELNGLFGLPIWDNISLYDTIDNKFINLNVALLTVTQQKNIIKTNIQGLNGSVKEYINDDDYQINIKATIVGQGIDVYPAEDIKDLIYMVKLTRSIKMYSTVLNKYFGLNTIVITDYSINQAENGMRNVQSVEINALTDNPELYKVIMQY